MVLEQTYCSGKDRMFALLQGEAINESAPKTQVGAFALVLTHELVK